MPSKYPPRFQDKPATECRECGVLASDGAQLSARGLCRECGHRRSGDSNNQLMARQGPHYEEWKRGIVEHAHRLISS